MYCFACCSPWDRSAAHSRCTVGRVGSWRNCSLRSCPPWDRCAAHSWCTVAGWAAARNVLLRSCPPWDRLAAHSRCTGGRVGSCRKRTSSQLPSVRSPCGSLPVYSSCGWLHHPLPSHGGRRCLPVWWVSWGSYFGSFSAFGAPRSLAGWAAAGCVLPRTLPSVGSLRPTPGIQLTWVAAPPAA